MSDWSYMNFEQLISNILNGDICIKDPIMIQNSTGDKTNHISFLSHLLEFKNIHDKNILETLYTVLSIFDDEMKGHVRHKHMKPVIERIYNEWYTECPASHKLKFHETGKDFFKKNKVHTSQHKLHCDSCTTLKDKFQKEYDLSINDPNIVAEQPLKPEILHNIDDAKQFKQELESHLQVITDALEEYQSFEWPIYIDLSMKHKSL